MRIPERWFLVRWDVAGEKVYTPATETQAACATIIAGPDTFREISRLLKEVVGFLEFFRSLPPHPVLNGFDDLSTMPKLTSEELDGRRAMLRMLAREMGLMKPAMAYPLRKGTRSVREPATGHVWPSVAALSRETGAPGSTIYKHLAGDRRYAKVRDRKFEWVTE